MSIFHLPLGQTVQKFFGQMMTFYIHFFFPFPYSISIFLKKPKTDTTNIYVSFLSLSRPTRPNSAPLRKHCGRCRRLKRQGSMRSHWSANAKLLSCSTCLPTALVVSRENRPK